MTVCRYYRILFRDPTNLDPVTYAVSCVAEDATSALSQLGEMAESWGAKCEDVTLRSVQLHGLDGRWRYVLQLG
jgi:hypothetical protein